MLGIIAFMYVIFGLVRASARRGGTWHVKYDGSLVFIWGLSAVGHYLSHHDWAFAYRGFGVALLSIAVGHVIYLLVKPQPRESKQENGRRL